MLEYGLFLLIALGSSFVVQYLMLKILVKNMAGEIGGFVENIDEMKDDPVIKRALSHIGKMGGDRKSIEAAKDNIARDVIQSKFGKYLPILDMLGVDVNSYLDQYGASNLLAAATELAPQLGFDLSKGLESLNIGSNKGNGGYRGKMKYGT